MKILDYRFSKLSEENKILKTVGSQLENTGMYKAEKNHNHHSDIFSECQENFLSTHVCFCMCVKTYILKYVCIQLGLCHSFVQKLSFSECPLYLWRKVDMIIFDRCSNRGKQGASKGGETF